MLPTKLRDELFAQLAEPIVGEELFDQLTDLVYFVKNRRGEYVVVNRTLVERCGCQTKNDLLGRRADELFPPPLGLSYRLQDERVLRDGQAVLNQLEVHFHATGGRGWCVTNKLPLRDRDRKIIGLVGVSKDLFSAHQDSADYAAVAGTVRHIQECYGEPLRVRELARGAGLSEYQFERRVRKIFQLTAGQLIQKTRLEAALQILGDFSMPIVEVAAACGYSDQSAFTRKFRLTVGMTPSAYRATQAQQSSRRPPTHDDKAQANHSAEHIESGL